MPPKLYLHDHHLVAPQMSRHHFVVEVVGPFLKRHPIPCTDTLHFRFVPRPPRKSHEGAYDGCHEKNSIYISTKSKFGRYNTVHKLVWITYHELWHAHEGFGYGRQRATRLLGIEEADRQEEKRANFIADEWTLRWSLLGAADASGNPVPDLMATLYARRAKS